MVNSTPIVQAYKLGKYIGRMDFKVEVSEGKVSSLKWENTIVPLESKFEEDQSIAALTEQYRKDLIELHGKSKKKTQRKGKNIYWFARLCRHCHEDVYDFWSKTDHANAMETLKKENAHLDYECVGCHTVGFPKDGGWRGLDQMADYENVQCEACHGPRSDHSDELYLKRPKEEKTCLRCHDDVHDPEFDFKTYLPRVACPKGEKND